MSTTTTNLGLTVWSSNNDVFDYNQLANNWILIDNKFSPTSVFLTPIRFIELVSVVPAAGTQGRLVYLTVSNGGFAANTILRDSGSAWESVGPVEVFTTPPTTGNYAGRLIVLSQATSQFSAWNVLVNTDGSNGWKQIGALEVFSSLPTSGNYVGRAVVLSAANGGFSAYEICVNTDGGNTWRSVSTEVASALPTQGNYPGRAVVLSSASGGFDQWSIVINTDGSNAWRSIGNATTSTSIAGVSAADGKIVRLRMGTSPYDFITLYYDSTYGHWLSEEVKTYSNSELNGGPTTADLTGVNYCLDHIRFAWKPFVTAGLNLQVRWSAGGHTTSGTPCHGIVVWVGNDASTSVNVHAAGTSLAATQLDFSTNSSNTSTGNSQYLDTGWINLGTTSTINDYIKFFVATWCADGSPYWIYGALFQYRWVA